LGVLTRKTRISNTRSETAQLSHLIKNVGIVGDHEGIFGCTGMRNLYLEFDLTRQRVGFAQNSA
jgi:hypothetical protein